MGGRIAPPGTPARPVSAALQRALAYPVHARLHPAGALWPCLLSCPSCRERFLLRFTPYLGLHPLILCALRV